MKRRRTGPTLAASILVGAAGGLVLRANIRPTAVPYVLALLGLVVIAIGLVALTARRSG